MYRFLRKTGSDKTSNISQARLNSRHEKTRMPSGIRVAKRSDSIYDMDLVRAMHR